MTVNWGFQGLSKTAGLQFDKVKACVSSMSLKHPSLLLSHFQRKLQVFFVMLNIMDVFPVFSIFSLSCLRTAQTSFLFFAL